VSTTNGVPASSTTPSASIALRVRIVLRVIAPGDDGRAAAVS
jgi:hypothetical protein